MHICIIIIYFQNLIKILKNHLNYSFYGCFALSLTVLYKSFSSLDEFKSFSNFLIMSFSFSFSIAANFSLFARTKHCEILLLEVVGISFIIPSNSGSLNINI